MDVYTHMNYRKNINLTEQQEIVADYINGSSSIKISKKRNINPSTVYYYIKKGVDHLRSKRKYKLNEQYFDKIDTEDKAYFLGLFFADGYNNEKNGYIRISLQEEDKEILDKFNTVLQTDRLLEYRDYKSKEKTKHWKNQYCLTINNKYISKKLASYGAKQKKSTDCNLLIKLKKKLIPHFIRGFFDGDGSIFIARKASKNHVAIFHISIVATKNMIEIISNYLSSYNIKYNIAEHQTTKNLFIIRLSSNKQCIKFYNIIYNQCSFYLKRKYNKFQLLLNESSDTQARENLLKTRNLSGLKKWRDKIQELLLKN